MGFGRFGLPCRYCTGVHSVPNTCGYSTNDEMREAVRSALKDGADCHGGTAQHDGPPSAQRVSNEDGQDGANETSQIVSRHGNSSVQRPLFCLSGRNVFRIRVDFGKVLDKRLETEHTTSDTLIITEQPFNRQCQTPGGSKSQRTRSQSYPEN